MTELGTRLAQARTAKGISLEEVEEATHIRRGLLRAIEEGDYRELPGEVYGRGLVFNYARYLGIDADAAVEEYNRHIGHEPIYVPEVLNEPLAVSHGHGWRWVAILGVVALIGLGLYSLYGTVDLPDRLSDVTWWPFGKVTPVAQTPAVLPTPPGTTTPSGVPVIVPTPADEQEGGTVPAVATTLTPLAEATARPTDRPTREPAPTSRPTTAPTNSSLYDGIVVEALVTAECYVDVMADGEYIYVGTMLPNETAQWNAESVMDLVIGNAGGIQLVVNGRDLGVMGESGEVLTLQYTPDNLPGQ